VLGFPCNQFMGQDPKTDQEIKAFVADLGVTFPMFSKIEVNGPKTHAVYTFLKKCYPGDITWNFASKFLVSRAGIPVQRFEKESWEEVEDMIQNLLAQKQDGNEEKSSKPQKQDGNEEKSSKPQKQEL